MSESEMVHGALEFGLLGAFDASRDGEVLSVGGRRQRAILAMLVCETGHAVSVERLIDGVWGDPAPPGVVTSVQSYVFHLRQVLEPDRPRGAPATVLVTVPGGYRLVADRRSVDATRFEELVAAGDAALGQGNPERAVTLYGQALSLWRGDVLADLGDYDFVAPVRARLEEERASALESRVQAELDLGHHQAVVNEIGTLIADHPLRERLHAQRILALYRSGRQSDALAAYRELRSVLDTELGIEPSPPLQELNNQVLRQDPALDWRPPAQAQTPSGVARLSPEPVPVLAAPRTGSPRRRLVVVGAAVALLAGGAALPVAGAPSASAGVPANAVSELDSSGSVVASVPVGINPTALAPAGGALWVVTAGDNTVSKINPSSHSVEQRLEVGHDPRALATTGDDLWVANFADDTVSRINVEAGKVVAIVDVGDGPAAIAAGPAGLWVANSADNTIQRIDPATRTVGRAIAVDDGPDGLFVDDISVWVANGRAGSVMRIDARSGDQMTPPIRVGSGPRGIVRAGGDVWVADERSQTVTRITVSAPGQPHSLAVGDGPTSIAVLGGSVWVAEKYSGNLVRIDPVTEDRSRVDLKGAVHGLAVVDGRLWVASGAFASTSHLGGTLRVAAGLLPGHSFGIDPVSIYDIWTTQAVRVVYDGLLAYHYSSADPQSLVPDLATGVPEPTDQGRTYTFNLRPGIRYSTGPAVRASDFELGVRRALVHGIRPDFYAGIIGGQGCIDQPTTCDLSKGVVTDDAAGRVTFHLVKADPEFLYKLTLFVVPTPPGTPLGMLSSPLPGTGPYRISSFDQDKEFALARNPYFQLWSASAQPAGFLDTIIWTKVADAEVATDAVQQGRADLAELTEVGGIDGASFASLIHDLAVTAPSRLHRAIRDGTGYVALNSSVPPFDDVRARRAFNYAFDRWKLINDAGGSMAAIPTCQLMPPTMPSYRPYCPYTTGPADGQYHGPDLARARALVRASGTRGMKVTVTDIVGDIHGDGSLEQYDVEVLRSIGYQAKLRRLPDTQANEDFFYDPRSGIQVESGIWIADFPVPSAFYAIVACTTNDVASPFAYCNPALDRRADRAAELQQTEPGAALRAWSRIDRALTDQAPMVPTANLILWWLTSERVGNYQNGTDQIGPLLSQIWVR
jgi:ABC-type transport system substrate-binding protein/DNA-binding SARP family transcriptional activator/DNA-binding beta-propeller fold protein YncE